MGTCPLSKAYLRSTASLATALACYATNQSLRGTAAIWYYIPYLSTLRCKHSSRLGFSQVMRSCGRFTSPSPWRQSPSTLTLPGIGHGGKQTSLRYKTLLSSKTSYQVVGDIYLQTLDASYAVLQMEGATLGPSLRPHQGMTCPCFPTSNTSSPCRTAKSPQRGRH